MDEEALKGSIDTYKVQLQQIEQAIQAAGETDDLVALRRDLQELIHLTEDSLLSLKKSQLLTSLDVEHGTDHEEKGSHDLSGNDGKPDSAHLDDEYAAFQEMLGDDVTKENNIPVNSSDNSLQRADDTSQGEDNACSSNLSDIYKDIIGTRCRAPFSHEWGSLGYHNALIAGIEEQTDLDIPKVRVLFCNPTHSSMLPCRYYLEDKCRFSDLHCRYSHGYLVDLEDLKESEDLDYSCLKVESKCLARYDEDDLWYKATVVEVGENHDVTVTFDSYADECVTVPLEDILPTVQDDQFSDDSASDSEQDINSDSINRVDSDDDNPLPVYLWKPPSHGLGDLGQWEAHTRGIGSQLMAKMGYEPGKGLGKDGEGRVQPIPIQLLPQGKSLDKIMRLKEIAGNRDMFDVLKKQERKIKKENEKREKGYTKTVKPNVFDFINKKLGGKKGKLSELVHRHEGQGHESQCHSRGHRHISEHELKNKSDRHLNIQLLKTNEEMKSVQKELVRLKQSLARNENRDKKMANQVREKIKSMENYLEKLKMSEKTMESHQHKRSNHKKMTVF